MPAIAFILFKPAPLRLCLEHWMSEVGDERLPSSGAQLARKLLE
jgi:hypothetical protein